jgi:GGDEF domain-containing protein
VRKAILALTALIAVSGWLVLGLSSTEPADRSTSQSEPSAIAAEAASSVAIFSAAAEKVRQNTDAMSALATSMRGQIVGLIERTDELDDASLAERLDVALIAALQALQQLEGAPTGAAQDAALEILGEATDEFRAVIATDTPADLTDDQLSIPDILAYILAGLALVAAIVGLALPASRAAAPPAVGRVPAASVGGAGIPRSPARTIADSGMPPEGLSVQHLLSRQALEKALRTEQSRSRRYGHKLSVVVLTLNEADAIRESGGPDDLRYALDAVAELAVTNTRESDIVGELDETRIVVLAVETDPASAEIVAAKLVQSVGLFPFDGEIHATVSTVVLDAATDLTLDSI